MAARRLDRRPYPFVVIEPLFQNRLVKNSQKKFRPEPLIDVRFSMLYGLMSDIARAEISKTLVIHEATQLHRLSRRYYWHLDRRVGRVAGEMRSRTALIKVAIGEVQSSDRAAEAAVVDLLHLKARRNQ
jgi:hypothetical protein